jgi:Tfp pilus assembly protein PilV
MWRLIGFLVVIYLGWLYLDHRQEVASKAARQELVTFANERQSEALEDSKEQARENLQGSTYQDNFGSAGCTSDCSGHDAGFDWAQNRGLSDRSECSGNSNSFIEGCEAYFDQVESRTETGDEE